MASRGQAERLPGASFFFPLVLVRPFLLTIHLFIHSFIYSSVFFICPFYHSETPIVPKVGLKGRLSSKKKEGFCSHFLSLSFSLFLESLFPRFIPSGPLSSLVECPTLWCVLGKGWRGRQGLWF